MIFSAGMTFLYPLEPSQTAHLWMIVTRPDSDGRFAVVSFTSLKGAKDQTVILRQGEHPFLKWDTCVAYALAQITTTTQLDEFLTTGEARMNTPATYKLQRLVLDGFLASDQTKNRVRTFITNYKTTNQT